MTHSRQREFIVLQHNPVWYEYLSRMIEKLGFTHVNLIHAPLVKYGNYQWYDLREHTPSLNIGLVICDGPPGSTQGGAPYHRSLEKKPMSAGVSDRAFQCAYRGDLLSITR
jgi:hypothetical protein